MLARIVLGFLAFGGETHDAAKSGGMEGIQALINDNPDLIFGKDDQYGQTALYVAVKEGHKEVAMLLLTNKADVDAKATNLSTPLLPPLHEGPKRDVRAHA
jgi:ankyrin repeat protein